MLLKLIQFLTILLTALALVPAGAHVLALPNKIHLPQEPYFAAQQIYRGWEFAGIVLVAAIVADAWLAWLLRGQPTAFWLGLGGALCMAATLAVFFVWTLPANLATDNWLSTPPNWQVLRARWEYAHVAGAALTLAGLCLVVASVLGTSPAAIGLSADASDSAAAQAPGLGSARACSGSRARSRTVRAGSDCRRRG